MAKKKKRRGKKKPKKKKDKVNKVKSLEGMLKPDYIVMESPFKRIPTDKLYEGIKVFAEKEKEEFNKSLYELKNLIKSFDVCDLTTWFSMYCLTTPLGTRKEKPDSILQFHVELLQAIALQESFDINEWRPVLPQDAQKIEELLKTLSQSFFNQRYGEIDFTNEIEARKMFIIESMRSSTFAIRNWGYPDQIIRIVSNLFSSIDDDIKTVTGVSIVNLIKMCENIIARIEERINEHVKKTSKLLRLKKLNDIIDTYLTNFPTVKNSKEDLLKLSKKFKNKKDFIWSLICHSDLFIRDIYIFNLQECLDAYPDNINPEALAAVLETWSLERGGLKDYRTEHLFLANPIWSKPLIKLEDNKFCWPIPGLFFHCCFDLMESVFCHDSKLREKYEKRRSQFLEQAIENLFLEAFPQAEVHKGSQWHNEKDDKGYENDLLIVIDSFAIVVEAKSGKISAPARRGAPSRLKKKIKELIIEPSIQARRFAKYLETECLSKVIKFPSKHGGINKVDLTNVRYILTLGVTLESFSPLATMLPELYECGFIDSKSDLSPNMSLADLEIIFDLLETSCEKIHYLVRREQFERNATYYADEIDLLVFYLQNGFNIGDQEFNQHNLFLYGISKEVDNYFLSKYYPKEEAVRKPRPRRTQWWDDIINKLESKKILRWTEMALILLNVSYTDQKKFEKNFRKVKKDVDIHWKKPGHHNSVILYTGPQQRRQIVIGLAYKNIDREERNLRIKNIAIESMEKEGLSKALVIGVDVGKNDYPYSILAVIGDDSIKI